MADPIGVQALALLLTHPDADCGPLLAGLTVVDLCTLAVASSRLNLAANNERYSRPRPPVAPDPQWHYSPGEE